MAWHVYRVDMRMKTIDTGERVRSHCSYLVNTVELCFLSWCMVCSLFRLHILSNSEYTTNLQWQRTCNIHVEIAYNAFYSKVQMCPDTFSKTPVARFLLATISCKWLLNLNIFFWVVTYWMFHCVYQFLEINLSKNRKHYSKSSFKNQNRGFS